MNDPRDISLSAAIVSYRPPAGEIEAALESLLRAVRALLAARPGIALSVTVVDNSEDGGLGAERLAAFRAGLDAAGGAFSLMRGHGNVGYGAAHNRVFRRDGYSTFHLLMNADVEMEAACLVRGVEFLLDNPDVAVASPRASRPDGARQFLCRRYPAAFDFFLRGFAPRRLRRMFDARLGRFEMRDLPDAPVKGVPIVSGCCMLCRGDALEKAGGFDGRYFMYFEDFDLSVRIARDRSLACLPAMRIVHRGGDSARKGIVHIGMFVRSAFRFYNTHGWRLF